MRVRVNDKMESYLNELKYDFNVKLIDLPQQLLDLLSSPILTINGCVLIEQICDVAPDDLSDQMRCEYEYSENHFHPDSFFDEEIGEVDHLKFGLEISRSLVLRLEKEFPASHFRILLSYSTTTRDDYNEIIEYASSTVWLHRIRSGVDELFRQDDLNVFHSEAVLEIET
jgi:hypothetical protein